MKTILAAVDFSDITPKVLDAAKQLARAKSKVYILHVAAPEPDFIGYGVGPQYIRDDRANELREEHALLAEYSHVFKEARIDAEALLVQGPTVETILNEVVKLNADVLVLGKRGHSKLYEVVLGSVCRDVLQQVKIMTLVVPEGE
jgi:nucleotide-binding universal stress UspA family protein